MGASLSSLLFIYPKKRDTCVMCVTKTRQAAALLVLAYDAETNFLRHSASFFA